jgi:hypothetical protein
MRFDWLLNPITQYTALAIGLTGCLALFVAAKRELQRFRRAAGESNKSIYSSVDGLAEEIRAIRASVRKLESVPMAPPSGSSVNLTRRAQALRMHRRGDPVNSIAPALGAPRNEIELLLKVDHLLNRRSS